MAFTANDSNMHPLGEKGVDIHTHNIKKLQMCKRYPSIAA